MRNGTQGVQNLQRAAQQKQILANDLRMRCLRSVQDAPKERSGYFAQRKPDRVCQVAGSKPRRAGIIAGTFEAFVQLVAARPYWLDILKFSAGGDLAEMRRAADALEATLDDEDEVNEAREEIRGALDLPEADDPVSSLYEAVAASDAIVRATDGSPFTTLFNRFSIDNNRMLRNAAA